jgi:translation initiation factor 2 alpha subunit (eIF-2alpha)
MRRQKMRQSKEQKTANQILELMDSLSIDLEEVGRYLGRQGNLSFNRLMIVIESAEEEKNRMTELNQTRLF